MKYKVFLAMVPLLSCSIPISGGQTDTPTAGITAVDLRVDALDSPVGISRLRPQLTWKLAAADPAARGLRQGAYQIRVATTESGLTIGQSWWDSGWVTSDMFWNVTYSGQPLLSHQRYYWTVRVSDQSGAQSRWSQVASFTTGLLRASDWQARWIAAAPDRAPVPDRTDVRVRTDKPEAMPIFRRVFTLDRSVVQALAFVSGLGHYELQLNGRNVTSTVLNPGWTNYRKTILYNSFDVTHQLHTGRNAIGIMLGNGMYNVAGFPHRYTKFIGSFGIPKLIFQMQVLYADGSETTLVSDGSWRTWDGPVVFSSTYGGEDFDARNERAGWSTQEFDGDGGKPVTLVGSPGGQMTGQEIVPITAGADVYTPMRMTEPKPGKLVYDFGQNLSGWPRLTVHGRAGATVHLTAGELLDASGLVTQRSANDGQDEPNRFSYTLMGRGDESWAPRFSYYGFRYVQVEGARRAADDSGLPSLVALEADSVHASVKVSGHFTSSQILFTKIHELIDRAVLNNTVSILTDCPHREKLGWLEQTHLAGAAIFFNYDVLTLYRKMADDIGDAQTSDGMVPSIAPEYVRFLDGDGRDTAFRDSPEFGSAAILAPWVAYQFSGDLDLLAEHYEMMCKYLGYLKRKTHDHLLSYGLGDWFDVGPRRPGESQLTSKAITATAIYYQDLQTLERIADLLGRASDAQTYRAEAEATKAAYNGTFFHADSNQYDRGSQTANAMPLVVGLAPEERRQMIAENLVADIRAHNNHVTAGDIGFHYVVRALTEAGRSDVLVNVLSRTDSPSYGYQLANGATSLTEAWDTNPNSSQNHFMLGHAEEWFYCGLAGLQFDLSKPDAERITIKPAIAEGIGSASAEYDSVQGCIRSSWRRTASGIAIEAQIPPGTEATIVLPAQTIEQVLEQNIPLSASPGIQGTKALKNTVRCTVGSGSYSFLIQAIDHIM